MPADPCPCAASLAGNITVAAPIRGGQPEDSIPTPGVVAAYGGATIRATSARTRGASSNTSGNAIGQAMAKERSQAAG